jgi:3-oxocholest-4-en-26-oate---CoA ligase
MTEFNLSLVFDTVARAVPDREVLVWRDRRITYEHMNHRIRSIAGYLVARGLGAHTGRRHLQGHESGQDHVGLYLRNGNEYLEAMVAAYRARAVPFNVNYRYVEEELSYLLTDANTQALIYHAEFAPQVAAIRHQLPALRTLIQVADASSNEPLAGAVDYESIVAANADVVIPMPQPTGDDLFMLYTGGTTGMPKGVLWRQDDIFMSSMGGTPFIGDPFETYDDIARTALAGDGAWTLLMLPPFMHGAAQWSAFHTITNGGRIVLPDNVERLVPADVIRVAEREGVTGLPVIGDAMLRPLIDEIEKHPNSRPTISVVTNGGAALTPAVRERLRKALPQTVVIDSVGSSESGTQAHHTYTDDESADSEPLFIPLADTAVLNDSKSGVLPPGGGAGWLARRGRIPLGYLGDQRKTAAAFPEIEGHRWAVAGDRAVSLADGQIQLLGRDSLTVNSGGEKIFVEEVERAMAFHPDIRDVVVVGRPSQRWGSEVVALVALAADSTATDAELIAECQRHVARYKLPKAILRCETIIRSPSGKADYRWAAEHATNRPSPTSP